VTEKTKNEQLAALLPVMREKLDLAERIHKQHWVTFPIGDARLLIEAAEELLPDLILPEEPRCEKAE
jgi:hypothetical protein